MKNTVTVEKNKDHVLVTNEMGEYHLSLAKFNEMGEEAAVKFAVEEINKKLKTDRYTEKTINFDQARDLGFCEYGIKDFCKKLDMDISKEYPVTEILEKLTAEVFLNYVDECRKLFGKDKIMNKFGGVKKFLSENRTRAALNFVLRNKFISDEKLHYLACDFAERVLPIFEEKYPDDNRPRRAIEVKRKWTKEEYAQAQ